MKIVHINNIDLPGKRFNGHDMQIELNKHKQGIFVKQFVMEKLGKNKNTISLVNDFEEPALRNMCIEHEIKTSIQSLVYPYGWRILKHPEFIKADIAHYHLIHNYFISLTCLPELFNSKPSVYTIHDPWIFSGHCIYSLECDKWKNGCGDCPDLNINIKMEKDNTNLMWNIKKDIFSKINYDIVVASEYMLKMAQESPITKNNPNIHYIPFGIDLKLFAQQRNREKIKKSLGIPPDSFILLFRADASRFKGLDVIKNMLDMLKPSKSVVLLTVGQDDLLLEYKSKYKIVQNGWVNDDELMAKLYCVCDVFLMPSWAEAFGLMAIEAMASSKPIIVMEGTSLPTVTFAPDCGISIKKGDSAAMTEAIERLMQNPDECKSRGQKGRKIAEKHYRFEDYISRHLKLYEDILSRNQTLVRKVVK